MTFDADLVGVGPDAQLSSGNPDRSADPAVAAALEPLAAAADLPPADQLAAYSAAHRTLQVALDAEIS